MRKPIQLTLVAICLAAVCVAWAAAQSSGSRGGMNALGAPMLGSLDPRVVTDYITVESSAEVRVQPTEIRVVLAVTAEGETAQECQNKVQSAIAAAREQWQTMGMNEDQIVVDFIALLPRYKWEIERQNGVDVAVEKPSGFRMQTNVHLATATEAKAQAAIAVAFEQGITDIIAFDYWSSELDEIKVAARKQAIEAAKAKADLLLGAVFDKSPPAINVLEDTEIRYPESLYDSFERVEGGSINTPSRSNISRISAFRPRNTYYRGLYTDGDVQADNLPMKPEISVVSTVRLYYESPAAAIARAEKAKDREVQSRQRN
ncbi:MAG: SIMPL domain-containing protein [Pirellulales bacterium]|nr:SIMPL domain-containing protein [Pirellulales bacterium]